MPDPTDDDPLDETQLTEEQLLVNFLFRLRLEEINPFLRAHGLPTSLVKEQLRGRLLDALDSGEIENDDLIAHLDEVEPWAAQQVVLYDGGGAAASRWATAARASRALRGTGAEQLLNGQRSVTLPSRQLELTSIRHRPGRELTVTAVHRREFVQRRADLDHREALEDEPGELIMRAYVRRLSRGLVTLRWNLARERAGLHISRLPSNGPTYEDTIDEFAALIEDFIDLDDFDPLSIGRAVHKLYDKADAGNPEARLQRFGVGTPGGRVYEFQAPDRDSSALGEYDSELRAIVRGTRGRSGNVRWLPGVAVGGTANPLLEEVHVSLSGRDRRVSFHTPNPQDVVTYVLRRIRALSR